MTYNERKENIAGLQEYHIRLVRPQRLLSRVSPCHRSACDAGRVGDFDVADFVADRDRLPKSTLARFST